MLKRMVAMPKKTEINVNEPIKNLIVEMRTNHNMLPENLLRKT